MIEWLVVGGGAALFTGVQISEKKRNKKYRETYRYIRIVQHEQNVESADQIKRWMTVISEYQRTWRERQRKGREWFRFLFHKNGDGEIGIYLGFPEDRITGIKNLMKNTYPFAEVHDIPQDELPIGRVKAPVSAVEPTKKPKIDMECGYFELQQKGEKEGLALNSYTGGDALEEILLSLHALESESWLDIVFSPDSNKKIKKAVERTMKDILEKNRRRAISQSNNGKSIASSQFMEEVKHSFSLNPNAKAPQRIRQPAAKPERKITLNDLDQDEKAQIQTMQKRYTGRESAFLVSIRILVIGNYAQAQAQTTAANIRSFYQMDNGLRFVKSRQMKKTIEDRVAYRPPHTFLMTGDELANIVKMPSAKHRVMQNVPYLKTGQRSLKPDELVEGISVGKLIHPVQKDRFVRIPHRQMNKMFLLTGKTGSGKSSELLEMLESLIVEWILNPDSAPGFTLSDPARDTAATILNRLRQKELEGQKVDWSRVHYFHAADPEFSVPLNLLFHKHGESPDDVVQAAMDMLTRLYSGLNAPQMERVMRNTLTTLVLDKSQKHTILGILPLLRDKRFRARVLAHVYEPEIKDFWKYEFPPLEQKLDQVISPILNRLSPFNTNKIMQRMFGQPDWNLPIREWMDKGHIVLFNWRGVNEQVLTLAGEKITSQYHAEFQARSTSAKTHYCIWDEAHRTPFTIIEKMIAEDRKFGASCGFSTQFPEQLPSGLLKAFKEIAGNVLTTTLGKDSAGIIQGATAGKFTAQFLQELPERVVAIYTAAESQGRSEQTTFTVECEPPYLYHPNGSGEWANHKDEAEMELAIHWGLEKGRELMARDATPVRKADEIINEYLRPGSILQTQAALDDNGDDFVEEDEGTETSLKTPEAPYRPVPHDIKGIDRETGRTTPGGRKAPSLSDEDEDEDEVPTESWDELYELAKDIVIEAQQASVSLLQRRLRIGYTRSVRIMDALEQTGVVGPYFADKPRAILVGAVKEKTNRTNEDLPFSSGNTWD